MFSYGSRLNMVGEVFIWSPEAPAGKLEIAEVATGVA